MGIRCYVLVSHIWTRPSIGCLIPFVEEAVVLFGTVRYLGMGLPVTGIQSAGRDSRCYWLMERWDDRILARQFQYRIVTYGVCCLRGEAYQTGQD